MGIAAQTKPPATITRMCSPGSSSRVSSNKLPSVGTLVVTEKFRI